MKNGPFLLISLFAVLAVSWVFLVLTPMRQFAGLKTYFDPLESQSYPLPVSGLADRGQLVYKSLGCAACHTEQVRRPGFGYDKERGWGLRQSVARDYMLTQEPQLGRLRRGPDLANYASRAATSGIDAFQLYAKLYNGSQGMPPYPFLFDKTAVVGAKHNSALKVRTAAGFQVLPSRDAEALVAYLFSLRQDYPFPESGAK
jgi:cytochrome c oxidase cbb3-type subunit II